MADENNIGNIQSFESTNGPALKSTESPWIADFYFTDFYDEGLYKKFIKSIEKLIRTSREYHTYIELLRSNINELNHDNIQKNITTGDVDLEFHHYPFTLYDIADIVVSHHIIAGDNITSFSIAKEIMKIHYENIIGLVPLTKTNHELAHSGNLFISEKQIFGNYKEFMNRYSDGISPELMNKVLYMQQLSKSGMPSDFKNIMR